MEWHFQGPGMRVWHLGQVKVVAQGRWTQAENQCETSLGLGGSKLRTSVRHRWDWEAADEAEGDSLKVAGCLGKVVLADLLVGVCWECTMGPQAVHLLDLFPEQAW
jgi:hypothetical protein